MGSFVFDNIDAEEKEQEKNNPEKKRRKDEKKVVKSAIFGEMKYFFKNVAMMKSTKLPRNEKDVVVLD